ncbi:hypothetical protein Ssi02_60490 [Sinosporangium siamense]|uniref:DUF2029 domain-containing protein n=1 Tax=Sinosporangium siamense TaxID=1367973 RepID=A0A919RL72_9ACTN|nr:hypothetical protein Ssi02_60490 [Sinosporangium siamense]
MAGALGGRSPRGVLGWFAVGAMGASGLVTVLIGLLGPSAVVPGLPGPSWHPPYSWQVAPSGHLVVAMAAAAIVLGTVGLGAALVADRRGDLPGARWFLGVGSAVVALLAFLPPSGSPDHLNYAAYGRMVTLGLDPYATSANDLPHDPVAGAVEEWRGTTSVYGPMATAVQALAGAVGGESVRLTVFVLALVNAAAFIGTSLLIHRLTGGDRRATLLWAANPLLVYHLAAGMHTDTLAIMCVVAATAAGAYGTARPAEVPAGRHVASGMLLGLGIGVKVNVGIAALGPAWELRRRPGRLAVVAGSAVLTVAALYALAGRHALDQVQAASRQVSLATPWQLVKRALQAVFGPGAYTAWIQVGSLLLLVLLAWLLLKAMTRAAGELYAAQVSAAVVIAWLLAAPYALPWYDGLAFAFLALMPALAVTPVLSGFLVARLGLLSLAYLPARQAGQPADLSWLVEVVRKQVVPALLLALTVAMVWWAWRAGARARTRPASAAPPR